jgi:hypothetical protein
MKRLNKLNGPIEASPTDKMMKNDQKKQSGVKPVV